MCQGDKHENAYADLIAAIETIKEGKKYISSLISGQLADIIRGQSGQETSDQLELLTFREKEVLKYIAAGKTGQEIAELLALSPFTVNKHRERIKRKLKIKRTADLVRFAINQGST